MLLTLIGDLATLAETVVLLLLFVFLSANVSVLVLRRDRVSQQRAEVWLFGTILLAVGGVLYLLAHWRGRRENALSAQHPPRREDGPTER